MTGRRLALALLLALAGGAAWADATKPITLTIPAGQRTKLRNHVKLDKSCDGSAPDITFSQQPAHGTVEITADSFVFGKGYVAGALRACEGQTVNGIAIWYTPAPGFHGTDTIAWTASFGSRSGRADNYVAIVTVQ